MNSKSKKNGKSPVLLPVVSDALMSKAQGTAAVETSTKATNPVVSTSSAEQPTAHPETDVRLLDLNKIVNSTYNPRKNFREETLLKLAESIKQSGVLQLICVRSKDEGFEIVYGERRYRTAAMSGAATSPREESAAHIKEWLSVFRKEPTYPFDILTDVNRAAAEWSRRISFSQ